MNTLIGNVPPPRPVARAKAPPAERRWWKESLIYQIYPRSFADSDGDGLGDLRGIKARLPHVAELGAKGVWLGPILDSPNDDNGYDIRNYEKIMREFGTMADYEALAAEAKRLGLTLLMDLVVNHTSDEHEWFEAAKRDPQGPFGDFYIFRDPRPDGGPPNGWRSAFGGSAWEFCPERGQYYLHLYSKKQPDLNWENPAVRRAIFAMMRFWLDHGAGGFRMDVINQIGKPADLYAAADGFVPNLDKTFEYLTEMNREVLAHYPEATTVGEMPGVSPKDGLRFTDPKQRALNMVFHFEHMELDLAPGGKWNQGVGRLSLGALREVLERWEAVAEGGGWNTFYFGNHDWHRVATRYIPNPAQREIGMKALLAILLTGRWTPFLLQGDEIGMTNRTFADPSEVRDIESLNQLSERVARGEDQASVLADVNVCSRDHSRTPMQWTAEPNAGFSRAEPWIGVNENYRAINVAAQAQDPNSIYSFCRELIQLRREWPVLSYGRQTWLGDPESSVYATLRELDGEEVLVLVNFDEQPANFSLPPALEGRAAEPILGAEALHEGASFELAPYEARVYRLAPPLCPAHSVR